MPTTRLCRRRCAVPVLVLAGLLLLLGEAVRADQDLQDVSRSSSGAGSPSRNRRVSPVAIPEKSNEVESKKYQSCVAPGSKPGHCTHRSSCSYEGYRSNSASMFDYMCIINKQFIGVCCPDDAASNDPTTKFLPAKGLAGSLPAVATEGDDAILLPDMEAEEERSPRATRGCGVSPIRDQHRVTGGRPSNFQEWPWVAAIYHVDIGVVCGGVLITDRHILTAAHCFETMKHKSQLTVTLGEYDFRSMNETRALNFSVVDVRIHKHYVRTIETNDIAILKIHRPTIFNSYIWPVCLPPVGATFENKMATVIGWGATAYGGANSYVLKQVTVPIWPQKLCASKFVQEITDKHLCAGAYEGNGDACKGDSGGPLLYQLGNGRWVSVGIVSWGIGCGNRDKPGIYTRTNAYLDWIFANTIF